MKVNNTRKQAAAELKRLITNGPSLDMIFMGEIAELSREDRVKLERLASKRVKVWLSTWVDPLVKRLVPELKNKGIDND